MVDKLTLDETLDLLPKMFTDLERSGGESDRERMSDVIRTPPIRFDSVISRNVRALSQDHCPRNNGTICTTMMATPHHLLLLIGALTLVRPCFGSAASKEVDRLLKDAGAP